MSDKKPDPRVTVEEETQPSTVQSFVKRWITKNAVLKVLSLIFAVMLWGYVITKDDTLRLKTVNNIPLTVTNQQKLITDKKLTLKDASAVPAVVSCKVRVRQSEIQYVNQDSVSITMDLSNITAAGEQKVRLRGTTNNSVGYIEEIIPASITVDVDTFETVSVPVKVEKTGVLPEDVWVTGQVEATPSNLTISGAASKVSSIAEVRTVFDMSSVTAGYNFRSTSYELYDSEGNLMDPTGLTAMSNVRLSLEALPLKTVPIQYIEDELLLGTLPEGYIVESISIKPDAVKIAADTETLSRIEYLTVESVSVENLTEPVSKQVQILKPADVQHMDMEYVNVNIEIGKDEITRRFEEVPVELINVPQGHKATALTTVAVSVTGNRTYVEALEPEDIEVVADCSKVQPGMRVVYDVEVHLADSSAVATLEPAKVEVRVE